MRKSRYFKSIRSGKRCNGEGAVLFTPKNTKSPPKSSLYKNEDLRSKSTSLLHYSLLPITFKKIRTRRISEK